MDCKYIKADTVLPYSSALITLTKSIKWATKNNEIVMFQIIFWIKNRLNLSETKIFFHLFFKKK